ncbi:MAG: hypothetical protein ACM3TT_11390 [Syntrophothermus sp.]
MQESLRPFLIIDRKNDDIFAYDGLNQLLFVNFGGNFQMDEKE